MTCSKCSGFMVAERSTWVHEILDQWRCINCSNYEDETVLFNRIIATYDAKERKSGPFTPRRYKINSTGQKVA